MSQVPFSEGDRVEIRRAASLSPPLPGGPRGGGAFYSATVLRAPARTKDQILVEFDSVASPSSLGRLKEYVPWALARPAPPRELGRRFSVSEAVEAYAEEGWHLGVVLEVFEEEARYLVFLKGCEQEFVFAPSNLRLRRDWTGEGWDPPFPGQELLKRKLSSPMELAPGIARRVKITVGKKKSAPLFKKGKIVEVSSDEEGYEGAWYTAVIKDYLGNKKYMVEYLTLTTDDETAPLTEEASEDYLRPYPPQRVGLPFRPLDKVDVWYNDGWWVGVISKVVNRSAFVVYFSTTNEELVFHASDLRIHHDWIDRKWVIASQDTLNYLGHNAKNSEPKMDSGNSFSSKLYFHKGMRVEVRSDDDGYQGSWFTAAIMDFVGEDKYVVEYQTLKTDDETELLKEEVRASHIRPCPPDIQRVYGFSRLEAVDAWYNEGWWTGHVVQILKDLTYQVYFRTTNEEMEFKHVDLRPHQEWYEGQWMSSLKDHIAV